MEKPKLRPAVRMGGMGKMSVENLWHKRFQIIQELAEVEKAYYNAFQQFIRDENVSNRSKKQAKALFDETKFYMIPKSRFGLYELKDKKGR